MPLSYPISLPQNIMKRYFKYRLHPLNDKPDPEAKIDSWGASRLIDKWAKEHGMRYYITDWYVVKEVNSKIFSFSHSPPLPGAALLHNEKETRHWMAAIRQDKVLKTAFGVSGRGHMHIKDGDFSWEFVLRFLRREWDAGRAVIAEPWVDRVLDFSTQWFIEKSGDLHYCGATICHNDERGRYRSNSVGNEADLFGKDLCFLEEHKSHAEKMLKLMTLLGYFGHVGIDAMLYNLVPDGGIYRESQDTYLQPIVEINARKTMGWAALKFQERHCPDQCLTLNYLPAKEGLLPIFLLLANRKQVHFSRNLNLQ